MEQMQQTRQVQLGHIGIIVPENGLEDALSKKAYNQCFEVAIAVARNYAGIFNWRAAPQIRIGMAEIPESGLGVYFFDTSLEKPYSESSIYIADSCIVPCIIEAERVAERMSIAGVRDWKIENGLWVPNRVPIVLNPIPKLGERLFRETLEARVR